MHPSTTPGPFLRKVFAIFCAVAFCITSACTTDDAVSTDSMPEETGAEETGTPPLDGSNGFSLCGLLFTDEGPGGYATVIDSFDLDTTVDLASVVTLPPFPACATRGRTLWAGSGEAPTVTRYDIDEEGTFTLGKTVSFQNLGVTTISARPGRLLVVSDTKGYYIDDVALQVVVWNPSSMTIIETLSLDDIAAPKGQSFGISPALVVGDRVIAAGGYFDQATQLATSNVVLTTIEIATDAIVHTTTDRCGGASNTSVVASDDGYVYVSNGARTAARHRLGIEGTFPPCMVRMDIETATFDDDYEPAIADWTGLAATGELALGPDGSVFLVGYDETIAPITDETTDQDMLNADAWVAFQVDDPATATTATRIDAIGTTSGALATLRILDSLYIARFGADFSSTRFVNIDDPQNPVDTFEAPGIIIGVSPL
ncbi:MAG: hypothetical protein AAGA48_33230 [Myxococcota bacterium]